MTSPHANPNGAAPRAQLQARIRDVRSALLEIGRYLDVGAEDDVLRLVMLAPADEHLSDRPRPDFWTEPVPITSIELSQWTALVEQPNPDQNRLRSIGEHLLGLEHAVGRFQQEISREIHTALDRDLGPSS